MVGQPCSDILHGRPSFSVGRPTCSLGKFGVVAGTVIFSGAIYFNT